MKDFLIILYVGGKLGFMDEDIFCKMKLKKSLFFLYFLYSFCVFYVISFLTMKTFA